MNLGTRTFIVLKLEKSDEGYKGTLSRPERFTVSDGGRFSNFTSGVTTEDVASASEQNGKLRFSARNASGGGDQREYEMVLTGAEAASLKPADTPLDPWPIARVRDGVARAVYTDWEPRRFYSLDDNVASNPEMQRLYESDQRDREDFVEFSREADAVAPGDAQRRAETRKLLMGRSLRTAEDYKRAAFIFQHGTTPNDFLLAHTLSMVAVAKGDPDALWIASATLDRYLQATGKRQIYGTQIKERSDHTATLEPYDRELVSDGLRRELGVQPLAIQEEQLPTWTEKFKEAAANPK